jgi:hypothetical protein
LLLLGAASARAGTYEVHACGQEAGFTNNSWQASASRGMLAYTKCPTRGDPIRGIVVRNEARSGEVPRGARAKMRFRAPAGASLAGVEYDWEGRRVDGEWSIGFATGDGERWLAGCRAGRPSMRASCRLGGGHGEGDDHLSLSGYDSVRLEASCGRSGGCETRPTGDRRTGRSRARLRMSEASVRVEDTTRPRLSVSGELVDEHRWLAGTRALELSASDNVGIRATRLAIDGVPVSKRRRTCDYTRPIPCGNLPSRTDRLDTARLRDGRHVLSVDAVDTADNRAVAHRAVQVDNHAPRRVGDLRVEGGEDVRSTNSFDLRWTAPPDQAAPIVRAHYRLCPANAPGEGRTTCTTGARTGSSPSIAGLSVPRRGDYTLQVWLEDAAGNVDHRTASNRVRLRFDDRIEARLDAGMVNDRGRLASELTVPYGDRALARGALRSRTGEALRDARVDVLSRTRGSDDGFRRVATVVTDGSGRFEHLAARGPSRTLRFDYTGSERHRPASDDAKLGVRASSTMHASRRTARDGDRVRFSGRLRGRPFPAGGKLVELQARYRERWRAFEVVRADRRGEWSHRYRFGGTRGVVTYPFRAMIRREADYPYERGHSEVVKVRVDGR